MTSKYGVHPDLQYKYSDIGDYIGEGYTDRPLRNDELVKILNSQDKRIKQLEAEMIITIISATIIGTLLSLVILGKIMGGD